jgi:adenosine kinase
MVFPGRIAEQLLPDQLDRVSLSFLVDRLEVRRGGVAANIAVGLARLGQSPVLVGSVGADFGDYEVSLKETGVDTACVRVSATEQTARFVCVTDQEMNQIAAFYTGAMAEAREIDLREVADRAGPLDLVLVSPNDPQAMLRHTADCRELGIPFAADPSQQLATLDGEDVRSLVDGAQWLFTNEYEAGLLRERTGWSDAEVLDRVGTWITTLGGAGVSVERAGEPPVRVPAVAATATADPTGVGDAFRAGFLAGHGWGLDDEAAARLGCVLATTVLEAVGTQEYTLDPAGLTERIGTAYGAAAAARLAPHLEGL